jgi:type I restriction enzyme R subunit
MNKPPLLTRNFAYLQEHDEQFLRLGMLAERYFPDDPNTSRIKLRQLAELLVQRKTLRLPRCLRRGE